MPIAITWVLRALARILSGWWIPLVAVVGAWLLEQATGAISWGIFSVAQVTLDGLLFLIQGVSVPATVSEVQWRSLSGYAVQVGALAGLWTAIGLYISSLGLRLVAWVVTLGRF